MRIMSALRKEVPLLLPLFLPIMVSQYAAIANGVIDTAMAGSLGTVSLASIAVGAAIWVPFSVFCLGTIYGLLIGVSQASGANDSEAVNSVTQQGMYLGVVLGTVVALGLYGLTLNLEMFGIEPEMAAPATEYIRAVVWVFPLACLVAGVRFYCEGQEVVIPVTVIALISVVVKGSFNYVFMFGKLGLPAMGVRGCGYGTVAEYMCFLLMLIGYVSFAPRFADARLFRRIRKPDFSEILEILKRGLPIGLCLTSEFLVFSVMTIFISHHGAVAAAAHQVAFNCMILFFSMAAAFSSAACIRVGNLFGSGDKEALRLSVTGIVSFSVLIGCVLMAGMVVKAHALASLFTQDMAVISLAVSVLYVAAFFQIADTLQVCLNGVLRGMGDVAVPFLYTTIGYWCIGIPLGFVLSGTSLPFGIGVAVDYGVVGWWISVTVALVMAALVLGKRVNSLLRPEKVSL